MGLTVIAALVWNLVPPLVLNEAFLSQFSVAAGYFYANQPAKSLAFEVGCLACPFVVVLSYVLAAHFVRHVKDANLPLLLRGLVGLSWLFFLWCFIPFAYCPHPPLEGMPPSWLLSKWFFVGHSFLTWTRYLYAGLCAWFIFFLASNRPSRRNRNLAFLALLFAVLLLVPSDFYTASAISDDWRYTYHFNVVTHALAQTINGHHLLIHFPHIYGGYVEFLGPLLALFPRQIETLLWPFPLLHALAVLGLILTARLVIRDASLIFLTGLSLLALEFMLPSVDHYYPYDPIRTLFPCMGLLAATLYFRRPTWFRYGMASGLAALAPLWNLDTGLVLWLSWTAALLVAQLSERRPLSAIKHLAMQTGMLLAAGVAFLLYLKIVSGRWPDPLMFVTFQKLVMGSGYMCVGLLVPDAWMIILTIYLTGLVTAFHFYFCRTSSWRTPVVLMLSLMGVGLFSYFMGRSAESNLALSSYPAVLLAGILLSETRGLIQLNQLPQITRALFFPVGLMLTWWAMVFTLAFPDLLALSGNVLRTWNDDALTPFKTNAAFVQKWIQPGDKVFMLSTQSGFYSYLSDTVCPMVLPSPGELLMSKDMERLITGLNAAQFPKLIVEQNFYTVGTYNWEIYHRIQEAVTQHYRAVATSETGQVTLYVPR